MSDPGQEKHRAEYHPVLGWVPNPGVRIKRGKKFSVNNDNIRTGDTDIDKPFRNHEIILTTGDSYTFGDEVSDHETWPAYLDQRTTYTVMNGGVFAYGLDQIVLRSEQLILKHKPKILILSFIADDIYRCGLSVRRKPKPYFTIENQQLKLNNNPVPLTDHTGELREMDFFRRIFGYSYFTDFIMRRINAGYWLNHRIAIPYSGGFKKLNHDVIDISCRLLKRIQDFTIETNTELVILIQYDKHLKKSKVSIDDIINCARENGLNVLDLYNVLESHEQFKSLYSNHMTPKGNNLVAQEVYKFLKENKLLE